MMFPVRLLVAALALTVLLPVVAAWGRIGHAAIANTAWELMETCARDKVYKYLPSNETMEGIASWADQYAESPAGNWSAHLHYVNMNAGQTQFEMSVDCVNGCVVSAILNNTALIVSQDFLDSLLDEPNALEFLVHFVGDVHQPLHVGWGSDRGGNDVNVTFFDKATELHAVWDTGMIMNYNSDYYAWSEYLLEIIQNNQTLITQYTQMMDPSVWAQESFEYVLNDVYNFNPEESQEVDGSDTPYLGPHYYDHNLPIVTERLTAASIRLAALLTKVFSC